MNADNLYSSSSSFSSLDYNAVLMVSSALLLSKAEQEKKMLAKVGYWELISVVTKTGRVYNVIASKEVNEELLLDQPSGEWKLPEPPINKETQAFIYPNDLFYQIISSSPLKH
jgi:hypothetical protein